MGFGPDLSCAKSISTVIASERSTGARRVLAPELSTRQILMVSTAEMEGAIRSDVLIVLQQSDASCVGIHFAQCDTEFLSDRFRSSPLTPEGFDL